MHGISLNAIDAIIAGGGDQIRLIGHTRDKMTISEGDRIQVVGAIAIPNVEYIDEIVTVSPGWRDIRTEEMVDVEQTFPLWILSKIGIVDHDSTGRSINGYAIPDSKKFFLRSVCSPITGNPFQEKCGEPKTHSTSRGDVACAPEDTETHTPNFCGLRVN